MFCKACGKEITDDSVYCSFCGTNQLVDKADDEKLEKTESGNPGKIKKLEKFGRTALPVAKKIVEPVVMTLINPALSKAGKEIEKSVTKKFNKATDQGLKYFGFKKTPVDSIKKKFTTIAKNKKK